MTYRDSAIDTGQFRRVMASYPTGVTIVTAATAEGPVGMTANSFTSVSLDPPLILFCAALTSTTWPKIYDAGQFAVNVMSHRAKDLVRQFAAPGTNRFDGVQHRFGEIGAPVLLAADVYLECLLEETHQLGDHALAVGRVVNFGGEATDVPLIFHRQELQAVFAAMR